MSTENYLLKYLFLTIVTFHLLELAKDHVLNIKSVELLILETFIRNR